MNKAIILFLSVVFAFVLKAQETRPKVGRPLDIPMVFAGNFGELRPNHFHSGLDFKTQGRTGLKIYSIDDGYVSRATVSPWGFGRALYVVHPHTGLTSVYGHLEAFSPEIDKRVRNQQYADETFTIDVEFEPSDLPVKKGDIIALSGNAGSSGGPHLHMDIRVTDNNMPLDPMEFYREGVKDKTPPEVRHIGLYPVFREGSVDGGASPKILAASEASKGFKAWGKIYAAVNAFDRMTGTSNVYGVKYLSLFVDDKQVYRRVIDCFDMDATRAVNTLADYGDVVGRGRWMMKTHVPATQPLSNMIETENNGAIEIDEERTYKFEYVLEDALGNRTRFPFVVKGEKCEIPHPAVNGFKLNYDGSHYFNIEGSKVVLPKGALYDDIYFNVSTEPSGRNYSKIFSIGDQSYPLATGIDISIPVEHDVLDDKSKYCLVRVSGNGRSAIDGAYADGMMHATIYRFGRYAVAADTIPPVITPLVPAKWSDGVVKFKISDNLSGVAEYRGEIDGKFALFEFDGKTATVWFKMDSKRFKRGQIHKVVMTVYDGCGNEGRLEKTFRW